MDDRAVNELANVGITHARRGAAAHAFGYRAHYLVLPLSSLARERHTLFSLNRFNLFSFYAGDHGDGRTEPETWARELLAQRNISEADGDITLITLPRILGLVFNPVSFWLCNDAQGRLRAVIAEVNNTYGERHVYVCAHYDRRPIEPTDWLAEKKAFYVSPFLNVTGEYRFRFAIEQGRFAIHINHYDENGLRLTTGIEGPREPLTSLRLLLAFLGNPLLPVKVIGLIHWQAVRLMLKGHRQQPKPAAPEA